MVNSYFDETDFFQQRNSLPDHSGHRQRIYKRFEESNIESFADHEILEMLLFFVQQRCDTKPFAKELIRTFGSIEKVFYAPFHKLKKIKGVDKSGARLIKLVSSINTLLNKRQAEKKQISIKDQSELLQYLKSVMKHLPTEHVRIILINSKNKLIKDVLISKGSETQAFLPHREILKIALTHNAVGFILVHNHPSGDITPSNEDFRITKNLDTAAKTLGIYLLDHIIISGINDNYYSFKDSGVL